MEDPEAEFKKIDTNDSGTLTFDEFCEWAIIAAKAEKVLFEKLSLLVAELWRKMMEAGFVRK